MLRAQHNFLGHVLYLFPTVLCAFSFSPKVKILVWISFAKLTNKPKKTIKHINVYISKKY